MKSYNIYDIGKEHDGLTLGEFLRGKLQLSRNGLVKVKKSGSLKVNGQTAYTNKLLKAGDRVEFELPDKASENILPEYMELDVVYEDEYMIVVNKEAGIPTHPSRNHYMGTLANGLMYHMMEEGREITIRPVNRLDKNTSGLVLFAKSSQVQHLMSMKSGKANTVKEYLAIAQGLVKSDSDTIDAPIAREKPQSIKRIVREDGDRAVTHYRVLERYEDCSLLSIILETGRTHQIRVHMAYLGHPLLGDELYGGDREKIGRQALHAYRLEMLHPVLHTGMSFKAEPPYDMQRLIRRYSSD